MSNNTITLAGDDDNDKNPSLFGLTLSSDNGEVFSINVLNDFTITMTGPIPTPVESSQQLAQMLKLMALQCYDHDVEVFENHRYAIISKAKEMDVKQDFIDLLESDLFYYKMSEREHDTDTDSKPEG